MKNDRCDFASVITFDSHTSRSHHHVLAICSKLLASMHCALYRLIDGTCANCSKRYSLTLRNVNGLDHLVANHGNTGTRTNPDDGVLRRGIDQVSVYGTPGLEDISVIDDVVQNVGVECHGWTVWWSQAWESRRA